MILEKIRSNKKLKWATTATLLWIAASVFIICFNRWESYELSDFDGLTDIILLVFFIPLGIACLAATPIVMKSKAFNRTVIALASLALAIATILVIEDAIKTYQAKHHHLASQSEQPSPYAEVVEQIMRQQKEDDAAVAAMLATDSTLSLMDACRTVIRKRHEEEPSPTMRSLIRAHEDESVSACSKRLNTISN